MNTEILLLISNILTGIAGFFVGKRRSDAETDNQVLRNLELSIGLYKNIIDDLKSEIHERNADPSPCPIYLGSKKPCKQKQS